MATEESILAPAVQLVRATHHILICCDLPMQPFLKINDISNEPQARRCFHSYGGPCPCRLWWYVLETLSAGVNPGGGTSLLPPPGPHVE